MTTIDFSENLNVARKYVEKDGHPLCILTEENKKINELCINIIQSAMAEDTFFVSNVIPKLDIIRKHYKTKLEYIYIPLKEKYGLIGPADYMSVDDNEVISIYDELIRCDNRDKEWLGKVLIFCERAMKIVNKEKNILFAAVVRKFNEDDYSRLLQGIMTA